MLKGVAALALVTGLTGIERLIDVDALAIAEETRTTTVKYSAFEWGRAVDADGKVEGGWTAEFHSHDWHRMESPQMRVVVNCRTHTGYRHDVATGQTVDAPNAYHSACGIYDAKVGAAERLSDLDSEYGRLRVIKLTDADFVRFYAIDRRGIIILSNWREKHGAAVPCIQIRAEAVLPTIPRGDIFSAKSLGRTIVPLQYKVTPRIGLPIGLSGACC